MCWLENFPGETWQQRWQCSPADNGPGSWHDLLAAWLLEQGVSPGQPGARKAGALALVRADVIRPSLPWLMSSKSQHLREAAADKEPMGSPHSPLPSAWTSGKNHWPCGQLTSSRC